MIDSRYAKQILFREIGPEGQEKISKSRVTVIGLGALGTVISSQLCRAGVGFLRLVDRDFVELSNLQRQMLFDEQDAKRRLPKTIAAAEKLRVVNSEIKIESLIADVTARNMEQFIQGSDLVLDGTDNLETRFLINDAALKQNIPWVYGGALGSEGMTLTIVPGQTACLRCLVPEAPQAGLMPNCDTEGVLSSITGIIASLETAEALKILTGHPPRQTLLRVDVWSGELMEIQIRRRPDCRACVQGQYDYLSGSNVYWTATLCGRNAVQIVPPQERQIPLKEMEERLALIGRTSFNGFLLIFEAEGCELNLFPNGRAIIRGTTDEAKARTFYAKYVGL